MYRFASSCLCKVARLATLSRSRINKPLTRAGLLASTGVMTPLPGSHEKTIHSLGGIVLLKRGSRSAQVCANQFRTPAQHGHGPRDPSRCPLVFLTSSSEAVSLIAVRRHSSGRRTAPGQSEHERPPTGARLAGAAQNVIGTSRQPSSFTSDLAVCQTHPGASPSQKERSSIDAIFLSHVPV